jgi:hypothetical protein
MSTATIVPNGINGVTGQYDLPPIPVADLARSLKSAPEDPPPGHVVERGRKLQQPAFARALPWGVEPHDIARAGWGVVFHRDEAPEVRKAIQPLIDHRRRQVGDDARVAELTYHPGETATAWLSRHDVSWHNVEPTRVPYYLLWVGSPDRLPFEVTHEIDSDYCVGLLDFDTPAEFARYAAGVIEYETAAAIRNAREAVFWGTRHPFDDATVLSADWLLGPMVDGTPAEGPTRAEAPVAEQLGFRQRKLVANAATRAELIEVLEAAGPTPSFLFTASHGMVWPSGDSRQLAAQGALLCQDWPGFGAVAPQHYLSAADVPETARVHGLVALHFACYGGGTPHEDLFVFERGQAPPAIAPRPFIAALPRKLLSHGGGGALACIAHVERAWGYSITGTTARPQIRAFQRAVAQVLVGKPVGIAVQEFNDLSATLSDVLSTMLGRAFRNMPVDDVELASTWTQRNDAGGFVLIGDPAVRLRVNDLV